MENLYVNKRHAYSKASFKVGWKSSGERPKV